MKTAHPICVAVLLAACASWAQADDHWTIKAGAHEVDPKSDSGSLLNGQEAAQTKQLPPTLLLQHHFLPQAAVSPFVGAGLNFTRFFNVEERGPLVGTKLDLGDSWGVALYAGVDFRINDRWLAGVDFRWIDIDTTARVNGAEVGTVHIDPLVYGAYVGYRF